MDSGPTCWGLSASLTLTGDSPAGTERGTKQSGVIPCCRGDREPQRGEQEGETNLKRLKRPEHEPPQAPPQRRNNSAPHPSYPVLKVGVEAFEGASGRHQIWRRNMLTPPRFGGLVKSISWRPIWLLPRPLIFHYLREKESLPTVAEVS